LAAHLQRAGHEVSLAVNDRHSETLKKALAMNAKLIVAEPKVAVANAEVVFLATPCQANEAALKLTASELQGKILVDCTNPVGPNLTHGLNNIQSGMQMIQAPLPNTKVVKAFNTYGFVNFENSSYPNYDVKPVMMYCGNDVAAKQVVERLIAQLGWNPLDVGEIEQALHLEHMALLWIRMVVSGHSPHLVWAALSR